jgi:hypothetical protein
MCTPIYSNMIYLCDLNMNDLKTKLDLPIVSSINPAYHSSRSVHRNDTSLWSGIHNPHQETMIGTFFKINKNVNGMRRVIAQNNKNNYVTVNIPPKKTLVFKGHNINHRAPNSMRIKAPVMFQTNNFNRNITMSVRRPRRQFTVKVK